MSSLLLKKRIRNLLHQSFRTVVLISLLCSQLSFSEIILYRNDSDSGLLGVARADAPAGWYDAGYLYRKQIIIDHNKIPNTDQSNFPVLISQKDISLKTLGNGGKVRNASGYDIIFSPQDGSAKLDHEIESYDAATGTIVMWVKIPALSHLTDTVIYLYYGNAGITTSQQNKTGVWDGNFKMVQHMNQNPAGAAPQMIDSTSNGSGGYSGGAMTSGDSAAGKIGNALDFDESDDYISISPTAIPSSTNTLSVSMWTKTSSGSLMNLVGGNNYTAAAFISIMGGRAAWYGGDWITSTTAVNDGKWHFLTFTLTDDTYHAIYVDGIREAYVAGSASYNAGNSFSSIAMNPTYGRYYNGNMDEVRISNIARSADWIKTEYNNQSNPTEFCKAGIEEVSSPAALSSFAYRKAVTIDHTKVSGAGSLANFPVLINLPTDANLAAHAQGDGDDILLTASGTSWNTGTINDKLAHEIESYDPVTGGLQLWVKIPELSNAVDTVVYVYYGNGSVTSQQNKIAVWDNNTKLVQHMSQDPAGAAPQMTDSTQYANNGTAAGTMTSGDKVIGKVGSGLDLDGTDDYINAGSGSGGTLDPASQLMVEFWAKFDTKVSYGREIVAYKWVNGPLKGYIAEMAPFSSGQNWLMRLKLGFSDGTAAEPINWVPLQTDTWYHLVYLYDGNAIKYYINGNLSSSSVAGSKSIDSTGNNNLQLGGADVFGVDGILDEVRISSIARSADWINTEYANQFAPGTFLALGGEQSLMDHFIIAGAATQTAGTTQTLTLTAIDAFGVTNSVYTGDKTISFSGANSINPNFPTFTDKNNHEVNFGSAGTITFTNGVAHTTVKLYKAENAEIEMSDGTYDTDGNSGYDLNVTVTLSALSRFDISSPPNITSETPFTLGLTALDAYGNITDEVADTTRLTVSAGAIDTSFIEDTNFQDDGEYLGTIIISEIYSDQNIVLNIQNGSLAQSVNFSVTGVLHSNGFVPALKPDIKEVKINLGGSDRINFDNLPASVNQFAVSVTSDFRNISWQDIQGEDTVLGGLDNAAKLYIKFRSKEGGVSDVLSYDRSGSVGNINSDSGIKLDEGDIVKTIDNPDVYIIKYKNNKQYKRLILSPSVFKSYGHLKWSNLKVISQTQIDKYITSNLVQVAGHNNIYELTPLGDTGERKIFDVNKRYDVDSVYEINAVDRNSYALVK